MGQKKLANSPISFLKKGKFSWLSTEGLPAVQFLGSSSIQYPQALSYHVPRLKLSPFYDVHIFDTDEHNLFP